MKASLALTAVLFLIASCISPIVSGQKVSCSCEKVPGYRTCAGVVTCPDGCTSLCGAGDTCYVSCRSDGFDPRITMKFVKKSGEEIASTLSVKVHKRIEFVPYTGNVGARYDINLNDDDLFNVLNYLYKRGKVRFDGVDFDKLKNLRNEIKSGKKISVNFNGITVNDALAKLAFASGKRFRIKSGNPEKSVSISLRQATINEIVAHISATADVKIIQ